MAFLLTFLGALLACSLELLEALAIVLAVALTRGTRDAMLGAGAAAVACSILAAAAGPAIAGAPLGTLRLIVGITLLTFGGEWLRKGILRLTGRRRRSSSYSEFLDERASMAAEPPPSGGADWIARTAAFKGVALEGFEVIVIVAALAARPGAALPAGLGAGVALIAVAAVGLVAHRPLRRVPETELKYVVGLLLTSFGSFFTAEGLGVAWPLGDGVLPLLFAGYLLVTQAAIRSSARPLPAAAAAPADELEGAASGALAAAALESAT